MEKFENVRGTQPQRPPDLEILESTVYARTNIRELHEEGNDEMPGFDGWEYDEFVYEKNEYIQILSEKNNSLESQLTAAQLALVEVYEMIGG